MRQWKLDSVKTGGVSLSSHTWQQVLTEKYHHILAENPKMVMDTLLRTPFPSPHTSRRLKKNSKQRAVELQQPCSTRRHSEIKIRTIVQEVQHVKNGTKKKAQRNGQNSHSDDLLNGPNLLPQRFFHTERHWLNTRNAQTCLATRGKKTSRLLNNSSVKSH